MSEKPNPVLKKLKITLESRYNNNQLEAPKMQISYGRIHLFEFGFDLHALQKTKKNLNFEILNSGPNFLQGYITDDSEKNYKLCINNKSSPRTKFGYNGTGAVTNIFSLEGENFKIGEFNAVVLYTVDDSDIFDKAYWWGRTNNELFAHLNEIHKSVFYLFIDKEEEEEEEEVFEEIQGEDKIEE